MKDILKKYEKGNIAEAQEKMFKMIKEDEEISQFLTKEKISDEEMKGNLLLLNEYSNNRKNFTLQYENKQLSLVQSQDKKTGAIKLVTSKRFKKEIKNFKDMKLTVGEKEYAKFAIQVEGSSYVYGFSSENKLDVTLAIAQKIYDDKQRQTLYIHYPSFLESIKTNFNEKASLLQQIKSSKRVIIDEFGQEFLTAWSRDEITNQILTARSEPGKVTTYVSIFSEMELLRNYTDIDSNKIKSAALIKKISNNTKTFKLDTSK